MLNEFLNYLYDQQNEVNLEYKFYISKVEDDRVYIDVYRLAHINSYGKELYEVYKDIQITDDIIEKFISGFYDINFDEYFIKNYIK